MTALTLTITNAGRAALVDAEEGGTTAVRIVEVGLTASVVTVAPTLTTLPGEFKRVDTVAGLAVGNDTVHLVMRDSSADTYTARAIALYLEDGTLFAVYGQAAPILTKAVVSVFLLAVDLRFLPGEAELVEFGDTNFLNPPATEDTMGVAYLATIVEALAGAVADKIITPAAMAAVLANYVASDQLGIPDGVATLGADGKLAIAQRPPIDLIDVFAVANQTAMLALAATVGDFAVRADNGLIYVLQATPATTLGNWLEISTPAPVSSVNGKVGTVVLTPSDIGAPPNARTVTGGGLATGGGDLSANRTITVTKASQAEASAGTEDGKALTPFAIAPLLTSLTGKVPASRIIATGGLVYGGGDLSADRTLSVDIASGGEIAAGSNNSKAVTPLGLAGLPKSLTPNGYFQFPGGLIVQWVQYRSIILGEYVIPISWPIVFPNAALAGSATGWLSFASQYRDLWPELVAPDQYGCNVQLQGSRDGGDRRVDGFDLIMWGY